MLVAIVMLVTFFILFFRQELTVVRASGGVENHKLDFGKTEKLVRMGCVTVENFRKRWNLDDGCFSYDSVSQKPYR